MNGLMFSVFALSIVAIVWMSGNQREAYERCEQQFSRTTCENILR